MKNRSDWLAEFDYLRAFAIVAVLAIHSSAYFLKIGQANLLEIANVVVSAFVHFAIPLFVFISGFVLYYRYTDTFSVAEFYKRRFVSIVPPYVIFSTFYILVDYLFSRSTSMGINVTSIFAMYLLGTSNTAFWYVILIIQLYVLYPVIAKMYRSASQGFHHGVLYLVSGSLVAQIAYNILIGSNDMCIVNYPLYVIFVSHIFYFVLGIAVCEHYATFKASVGSYNTRSVYASILLLGLFFAIVTQAYFFPSSILWLYPYSTSIASIILPPYSLLVFIICFRRSFTLILRGPNGIQTKYLSKIGAFSFGIYLTFPFFDSLFGYIVLPRIGIDWNTWLFYPLVFVLTLFFSYWSVAVLYRLPLSSYIIGVQRARKKQPHVHQVRNA